MLKRLNLTVLIIVLAMVLGVALTPALGLAKEKGKGHDKDETWLEIKRESKLEKRLAKQEHKETRYCFKAFGHLIAPGWIKNFGPVSTSTINCWLPFGIKQKFTGGTTTADIIPPVIRGVAVISSTSTISVSWRTNEPATSRLWYSTTTPLSTTTASLLEDNTLKLTHLLAITGLATNTPHFLMIESADASGNRQQSSQFTATTTVTSTP